MKKILFILLAFTFVSCKRERPIEATIKPVELQSDVKEIDTLRNAEFDQIKFRVHKLAKDLKSVSLYA